MLPADRALVGPFAIAFDPAGLDVAGLGTDVGVGDMDLFVPAAVIAGPGLFLLLLFALQAAGAMAWVPAVRRLRGEDAPAG